MSIPLERRPLSSESGTDPESQRPSDALMVDARRVGAATRLLPTPDGNPALNRLAGLAARLLSTPAAQISLLTDSLTIAAGVGLDNLVAGDTTVMDESLCALTAASGAVLVVTDARHDRRVAHLPPVATGAVGSYLGVPLVSSDHLAVGALCVFDPAERTWLESDIGLLQELAGSVMAELELSALSGEYRSSRLRLDLAIEAAGIASFDWDLRTGHVERDPQLLTLFGVEPGAHLPDLGITLSRIHPADRPAVEAAIASAIESCGDYRAEFRVVLPDGHLRWLAIRGRAQPGETNKAVRLSGIGYDVTEVRTARDQAAHLLATMATGFLSVDHDWRVTYLNATGERVVRMRANQLIGRELWEAFPGLEDLEFGRQYHYAVETGESVEFEAFDPHLGTWYEMRAVPNDDGLALYFLDITSRRAAQERAETTAARLELLATVSAELAATLETETAVARLAQLVVPTLADWCIVTLVEDEGLCDIGWWHAEPELRPALQRYTEVRVQALTDHSTVTRALRTGRIEVLERAIGASIGDGLATGEAHELMERLAPKSVAVLPLRARDRIVGLLTLYGGADRPSLTEADLATAGDVADRAGMALDNARLYSQQRSLAESLQRSLLTDPPKPEHCEIVVRYVPAAESASVGGDWFDSFLQASGATILVIGDVVGHDTEAAAAMGQVRGLLRGIAWHSGAGPAAVLTGLDAAMEGLQVATTATAIVAQLEPPSERRPDKGARTLRWSNAGHPPPMAIDANGIVSTLGETQADLLLGIEPRTARTESTRTLTPGATVLLYTDGLVERRSQGLNDGLALLRQTLEDFAALPLDRLCDQLLERMLPTRVEDDVALVAVRLHDDP